MRFLYDKYEYDNHVKWLFFLGQFLEMGFRDGKLKTVYINNRLIWGDLLP